MKKIKVAFLLDSTNSWIEKGLRAFNFGLKKKYIYKITKNTKIKKQDIVFPLCYTKILSENFLKSNKMVLIVHPSKLPQNKGFASIQYEILKNKKKFFVSLIKATKKVDAGPICSQEYFTLNGTELLDEIRQKQQSIYFKMIKKFLSKYPKVKFRRQIGEGNFNKKRHSKDSKLDINKTIKSQFNLLRINHNELYPSFFKFKNNKFVIKIYKSKK